MADKIDESKLFNDQGQSSMAISQLSQSINDDLKHMQYEPSLTPVQSTMPINSQHNQFQYQSSNRFMQLSTYKLPLVVFVLFVVVSFIPSTSLSHLLHINEESNIMLSIVKGLLCALGFFAVYEYLL